MVSGFKRKVLQLSMWRVKYSKIINVKKPTSPTSWLGMTFYRHIGEISNFGSEISSKYAVNKSQQTMMRDAGVKLILASGASSANQRAAERARNRTKWRYIESIRQREAISKLSNKAINASKAARIKCHEREAAHHARAGSRHS